MKKNFLKVIIIAAGLNPAGATDDVLKIFSTKCPDIPMGLTKIGGYNGLKINEFSQEEGNRNHWDARPEGSSIRHMVLHYTVCDVFSALKLFTEDKKDGRVSAHYIVTERTTDFPSALPIQVVPEHCRAWHAGISSWGGSDNLNGSSIGVEHVNKGFTEAEKEITEWFPFDPEQIRVSGRLCQTIVAAFNIRPQDVVGHSDIASGRKHDPGILFPWKRLHDEFRVGAWLTEEEMDERIITERFSPREPLTSGISAPFLLTYLQRYGYKVSDPAYITPENESVIRAFKAHFSKNQSPEHYNSSIDIGDMFWIWGLSSKYKD